MRDNETIGRIRVALGVFILGLVASGLTAVPIQYEIDWLAKSSIGHGWLGPWILFVQEGVDTTYAHYPFMAYGTDWLAFGHLAIALFFMAPMRDPIPNLPTIDLGLLLCALVPLVALTGGPLRGIPFGWRLVDCSFGVLGALPLCYARYHVGRLRREPTLGSLPAFKP